MVERKRAAAKSQPAPLHIETQATALVVASQPSPYPAQGEKQV